VNFGRVYCDFWYIYFYSSIFWDTRRWIKSKSTIRLVWVLGGPSPSTSNTSVYIINNKSCYIWD